MADFTASEHLPCAPLRHHPLLRTDPVLRDAAVFDGYNAVHGRCSVLLVDVLTIANPYAVRQGSPSAKMRKNFHEQINGKETWGVVHVGNP